MKDFFVRVTSLRQINRKDEKLVLLLLHFSFSLTQIIFFFTVFKKHPIWGYEYGYIAESIYNGEGFSNPFPFGESGPTAWMPPFLPYLFAFIFKICGGENLISYLILMQIKVTSYTLTVFFTVKILNFYYKLNHYLWVIPLFFFGLLLFLSSSFQDIADQWIIYLFVSLSIFAIISWFKTRTKKTITLLLIASLLLPTASPVFGLGFILSLFILYIYELIVKGKRNGVKKILHLSTIYLCLVLPFLFSIGLWSYRNYTKFNQFIPTKSNLWFEFYMINVKDINGIYNHIDFLNNHPGGDNSEFEKYKSKGEKIYLEHKKEKSKEYLRNQKKDYLKKIKNRLVNIFFFTKTYDKKIMSELYSFDQLSINDKQKLNNSSHFKYGFWWDFNNKDDRVIKNLISLNLEAEKQIIEEYRKNIKIAKEASTSAVRIVKGLYIAIVPVIYYITILITTKPKLVYLTISFYYLIGVFPYILVSHYWRYQSYLLILQVLIMALTISSLINKYLINRSELTKISQAGGQI